MGLLEQAVTLSLPLWITVVTITVGALSGALHANKRDMDITGVLIVAFATGLGGGAIRDVTLGNGIPIFLVRPGFILYAALGAVIALLFSKLASQIEETWEIVDTLIVGLWIIIGSQMATTIGLPFLSVVFIGFITPMGGVVLRDLLCHEPITIFEPGKWQASSVLAGSFAYSTVDFTTGSPLLAMGATIVVATATRIITRQYGIETHSAYLNPGDPA